LENDTLTEGPPGTLRVIEETLRPEDAYIDIGAWVGPTVLWAAERCRHVIAVEPDPIASGVLAANVKSNCTNVTSVEAAVAAQRGRRRLWTQGDWGDSTSTLVDQAHEPSMMVDAVLFEDVLDRVTDVTRVGLVKIDIEGGEGELFSVAARTLKALHCPIVLALHYAWVTDPVGLQELLQDLFDVTILEAHPSFPTVLLQP